MYSGIQGCQPTRSQQILKVALEITRRSRHPKGEPRSSLVCLFFNWCQCTVFIKPLLPLATRHPNKGICCAVSWWLPEREGSLGSPLWQIPDNRRTGIEPSVPTTCSLDSILRADFPFSFIREYRSACLCHHQPALESCLAILAPWVPSCPSARRLFSRQLCVSGKWDGRISRTLHYLPLSCWVCDSPEHSTCIANANDWRQPCVPLSRTLESGHLSVGLLGACPYWCQAKGPWLWPETWEPIQRSPAPWHLGWPAPQHQSLEQSWLLPVLCPPGIQFSFSL